MRNLPEISPSKAKIFVSDAQVSCLRDVKLLAYSFACDKLSFLAQTRRYRFVKVFPKLESFSRLVLPRAKYLCHFFTIERENTSWRYIYLLQFGSDILRG
jgi:hypothetical protein